MPRTELIKNSFVGGEISPFVLGRSDLGKYHSSCESISNFHVRVEGGIQKRWGMRYIIDAGGPNRLIPFILSIDQKYILEFGDRYIRFYVNDGRINNPPPPTGPDPHTPYTIATPYLLSELWDIHFVQQISVMYLTHPNHPPMKLIRMSDTNWRLIQPKFYSPPAIQQDQDVGSQKSANITITTGNTITASNPVFIAGDIGKAVVAGSGIAYINAFAPGDTTATDPATGATLHTQLNVNIVNDFDQTSYTAGNWFLRGGPSSFFSAGTFDDVAPTHHKFWSGESPAGQNGSLNIRTTSQHPTDHSWQRNNGSSYVDVTYLQGFTDTFRTIDQGSFVNFSGGYGFINTVIDSTTATITVLNIPTVVEQNAWGNSLVSPAPPGSWWYEVAAFGPGNYPHAACFYGDRLYFAGTEGSTPNTVWGSNISDYENFALGTLDDSGVRFTINISSFEHIHWMVVYQGSIVAGGSEHEFVINGGAGQAIQSAGAPITPKNINVITQSAFGVAAIQPLLVDNDLIFVQEARFNTYRFAFNAVASSFGSDDLNVLNAIITNVGFKEIAWQQRPYKLLWFTTLDNNLVCLTYDKSQDVWAWHRHFTGVDSSDRVISIADITVADGTNDELWLLCQRTREGVTSYSIEILSSNLLVDCGLHQTFPDPVSQLTGLQYLAGRTIAINANGWVMPPVVMDLTGIYNFPVGFTATDVQVGLPFTASALTVRPEPKATIQGLVKRWLKLWSRIYNTSFLTINDQPIPFQNTVNPNVPIPNSVFTGDVQINNLGFDRVGRIQLIHDQPLPCHVLSVFGTLEISEGV